MRGKPEAFRGDDSETRCSVPRDLALKDRQAELKKSETEMADRRTKAKEDYQKLVTAAADPAASSEERDKRKKEAELDDLSNSIDKAITQCLDAGWKPDELAQLGIPKPGKRRAPKPAAPAPVSSPPPPAAP